MGNLLIRGLQSALAGPFDLHVAAGSCAAISGASGSGKSLFLRMIADLDANTGEVSLDGAARESLTGPQWRRRVPYVAADSGWWREQVMEHFEPAIQPAARALAQRLGVAPNAVEGPVARLSTGERQRMAIIRALVLDAPALLLDEPTGPLDPVATQMVEAVLKERLAGGVALVLVSHDPTQGPRLGAAPYRMADRRLGPDAQ